MAAILGQRIEHRESILEFSQDTNRSETLVDRDNGEYSFIRKNEDFGAQFLSRTNDNHG